MPFTPQRTRRRSRSSSVTCQIAMANTKTPAAHGNELERRRHSRRAGRVTTATIPQPHRHTTLPTEAGSVSRKNVARRHGHPERYHEVADAAKVPSVLHGGQILVDDAVGELKQSKHGGTQAHAPTTTHRLSNGFCLRWRDDEPATPHKPTDGTRRTEQRAAHAQPAGGQQDEQRESSDGDVRRWGQRCGRDSIAGRARCLSVREPDTQNTRADVRKSEGRRNGPVSARSSQHECVPSARKLVG